MVRKMKFGDSPGCSDHEVVEFRILHERNKASDRIETVDFRRANFNLFKDLLGDIP